MNTKEITARLTDLHGTYPNATAFTLTGIVGYTADRTARKQATLALRTLKRQGAVETVTNMAGGATGYRLR